MKNGGFTGRQQARAAAHLQMDQESAPGRGVRSCALIALDDRFDDLAGALLDRLQPGLQGSDAEVTAARQMLRWRSGAEDLLGDIETLVDARPELGWKLLDAALGCAVPQAAMMIARRLRTAGASEGRAQRLIDELCALEPPGHLGAATARIALARLPDGRSLEAALRESSWTNGWGLLGSVERREPRFASSRWRDLFSTRSPRTSSRLVSLLEAWRARPEQAHGLPVLVPGGHLNRYTARHWIDALARWPVAVVWGLVVQDPGAFGGELVAALKRHAPIGVPDTCSALLLREWGVEAVVLRPERAPSSAGGREALWRHVPEQCPPEEAWVARVMQALRADGATVKAEDWRVLWHEFASSAVRCAPSPAWSLPRSSLSRDSLPAIAPQRLSKSDGSGPAIEVALTVDQALADELPVVMDSVLVHASLPVRFHLLTRNVGPDSLAAWGSLFDGRAEVLHHPLNDLRIANRPNLLAHTSESTLDRLLLPWILSGVDRVLYLDVDLVVVGDIAPLWRTDLGHCSLAAKPSSSPGMRWGLQMLYHALEALPFDRASAVRQWLHDTGPMGFRAFNAGVLVMDLERLRREQAVDHLLALVEHCAMNDQDALNAYSRGRYVALANEWNAAPRQDVTDGAKIVHFVGPVKPWHDLYVSRKPDYLRARQRVEQRRHQVTGAHQGRASC